VDIVDGAFQKINFETDALPYADGAYDTVVVCNVLEHIFNHRFLTNEMYRVLKQGGGLVGFVPFLFQYHPDPHDYFRYTKEALTRVLKDAGFRDVAVTEIGGGPFFVNYNTLSLSMPRVIRIVLFPLYALLDWIFLKLRPQARERYPLGYLFTAKK
jgi:SAM-dependent methyltransferase